MAVHGGAAADRQERPASAEEPHGGAAMLVITRREGEEVVVGDPKNPIGVVRIASIKGDRIRLAFDFPRTIDVHRREVAEQIAAEGDGDAAAPEIEVRVKDAAAPA